MPRKVKRQPNENADKEMPDRSISPKNPQSLSPRSRSELHTYEEEPQEEKKQKFNQQDESKGEFHRSDIEEKLHQLLQKFKSFHARVQHEADQLEQEVTKFIGQLNFGLKSKGKSESKLDISFFKSQFSMMHSYTQSLIESLELEQSSQINDQIAMTKDVPMKKKPKNRRKKKTVDDDLSFLDSVIVMNKLEHQQIEDEAMKVVELYEKRKEAIRVYIEAQKMQGNLLSGQDDKILELMEQVKPEVTSTVNIYAYATECWNNQSQNLRPGSVDRFLLQCCFYELTGEENIEKSHVLYSTLSEKLANIELGIIPDGSDLSWRSRIESTFKTFKVDTQKYSILFSLLHENKVTAILCIIDQFDSVEDGLVNNYIAVEALKLISDLNDDTKKLATIVIKDETKLLIKPSNLKDLLLELRRKVLQVVLFQGYLLRFSIDWDKRELKSDFHKDAESAVEYEQLCHVIMFNLRLVEDSYVCNTSSGMSSEFTKIMNMGIEMQENITNIDTFEKIYADIKRIFQEITPDWADFKNQFNQNLQQVQISKKNNLVYNITENPWSEVNLDVQAIYQVERKYYFAWVINVGSVETEDLRKVNRDIRIKCVNVPEQTQFQKRIYSNNVITDIPSAHLQEQYDCLKIKQS